VSLERDINSLRAVRDTKCNLEAQLPHTHDEVTRGNLQRRIEKIRMQEAQMAIDFTRTHLADIRAMMVREQTLRRLAKHYMPVKP
jgi:DNA replication initiation complex subunit (GINS family)